MAWHAMRRHNEHTNHPWPSSSSHAIAVGVVVVAGIVAGIVVIILVVVVVVAGYGSVESGSWED